MRRDAGILPSSEAILEQFRTEVGDRLFEKVRESKQTEMRPFSSTPFSLSEVMSGIGQVMAFMYLRGFCLKEPSVVEKEGVVSIDILGPIVLWSSQALAQVRAIPNEYDVMIIRSFLRQAGWRLVGEAETKTSESGLRRTFRIAHVSG